MAWLYHKSDNTEDARSIFSPTVAVAEEVNVTLEGEKQEKKEQQDQKEQTTEDSEKRKKDPSLYSNTRVVDGEEYEHFPYIIVGGGTAAFAAVKTLKESGVTEEILVISNETTGPYLRPPLSKELWFTKEEDQVATPSEGSDATEVQKKQKLVYTQFDGTKMGIDFELPEKLADGVVLIRSNTVTDISPDQKLLKVNQNIIISYGKCLIATGSSPKKLNVPQPESASITTFRTQDDFRSLEALVKDPKSTHITVVGGGLLGTELAYSIATKGKKTNTRVSLIVKDAGALTKYLPDYLSDHVTANLRSAGVDVLTQAQVQEISENSEKSSLNVKLQDGREVKTDHVVVAIGTQANTAIAEKAMLEIDPINSGIVCNPQWMVVKDLYAAGEVASHWDTVLGRKRIEHHLYSYDSGKAAAKSMLGGMEFFFEWPIFWGTAAGTPYTAIGIVDPSLDTVGAWLKGPLGASGLPTLPSTLPDSDTTGGTNNRGEADNKYERENIFENGIVYYTKNNKVVGVLLWNIYDKIPQARRALQLREREYAEISDFVRAVPWELEPKIDEASA